MGVQGPVEGPPDPDHGGQGEGGPSPGEVQGAEDGPDFVNLLESNEERRIVRKEEKINKLEQIKVVL